MTTKTEKQRQHLEPRPGSNYRTLFLKGRRIRAAVADAVIHGPDPRSAEEFAREYQVRLDVVLEALDHVAENRPLIEQELDHDAARLRARGLLGPTQGLRFLIGRTTAISSLRGIYRAGEDRRLAGDQHAGQW